METVIGSFVARLFRNVNCKSSVKHKRKLGRGGNIDRDKLCLNSNFF